MTAFDRAFDIVKNDGMITLRMPMSAYNTIMETLAMDMQSSMIEPDIRADLSRAMDQIQELPMVREDLPGGSE
tara:strand:- start:150 stop:368 length:219 start_codon:yes stop_codon:yes gene_type:complete